MATVDTNVGETLRRIRRDHRLSLRDVAEKTRISVATLSRVETNKQGVDVELLRALAQVFGITVGEILGERDGDGNVGTMSERARLFLKKSSQRRDSRPLTQTMDEVLSIIDLLRHELLSMQKAVSRRRKR